jgi:hypothetical protein
MQWNVYPLAEYPDELWQDWQNLVQQHHQSNPMLCADFVQLLVEYFSKDVYVAKGEQDNQLSALLLLEKGKRGIWQGFKPSQAQVALFVLDQSKDPQLHLLPAKCPSLCIKIDLFSLDPDEHGNVIQTANSKQCYATNVLLQRCSDFNAYWQQRPKNLRKNISRYFNKLESDKCAVRYEAVTDAELIKSAVDRYGILESAGWKGKNATALHPSNTQGQLYRRLLSLCAENDAAIVFETYLNEQLSASRLCIFCDHKFVILKTTFDENYKKYSLGKLNLYKLIEHFNQHLESDHIDFYTNASKEQIDWSSEQRPMYNISVYANRIIDKLIPALLTMREKLKHQKKAS